MLHSFTPVLGTLLLAALPATASEETHAIHIRRAAIGEVFSCTKVITRGVRTTVLDRDKTMADTRRRSTTELQYTEEILTREGDKRPGKLRRHYTRAQTTTADETTDLPYHGKTVLIERKGNKYVFRLEDGKELALDPGDPLQREFEHEDVVDVYREVLPTKPVAVNETWKIDVEKLARQLTQDGRLEVDAAKGTGTGKLVRVYQKDGHQYGEISYQIELPLKSLSEGKRKVALEAGSKLTLDFTLDGCIDGSVRARSVKGSFRVNASGTAKSPDGQDLKLTYSYLGTARETEEPAPRK